MASVVTNTEAVRVWIREDITLPIGSSLDHSACSHPDRKGKSKRRADAVCSTPDNSQLPNKCIADLQKLIEEQGIRGCRVTGEVKFKGENITLPLRNTGSRTCFFGPVHDNNNSFLSLWEDYVYYKCRASCVRCLRVWQLPLLFLFLIFCSFTFFFLKKDKQALEKRETLK
jgi:hypothetical protein